MVFLQDFLEKIDFKNQQTKRKILKNCPGCKELTIYFIINPLTPLKYNVYENSMENRAFARANAKFSIMFSKVFKT